MSDRPRRVTVEEFAEHLGVEPRMAARVKAKTGMSSRKPRQIQPTKSPSSATVTTAAELIDLEKVQFTTHALNRLAERMAPQTLKDPEKTAMRLLAGAVEDGAIDSVSRVRRLINNNFVDTRYFVNSGWRFVVRPENDMFFVLTIERAKK